MDKENTKKNWKNIYILGIASFFNDFSSEMIYPLIPIFIKSVLGVGANFIGIIEGIAVDTHVIRLAGRLGLTKNEDPVKIEKDLMEIVPKKEWGNITHLLIFHGRKICQAKKPMHKDCVLFYICPSRNI